MLEVTDASFDKDVLQSEKLVLVDFWAPWCGPCRTIAPILVDLAKDFEGKAVIAKINIDENPQVAEAQGIRSIPTLFLFKKGGKVDSIVGAVSKDKMAAMLNKYL